MIERDSKITVQCVLVLCLQLLLGWRQCGAHRVVYQVECQIITIANFVELAQSLYALLKNTVAALARDIFRVITG